MAVVGQLTPVPARCQNTCSSARNHHRTEPPRLVGIKIWSLKLIIQLSWQPFNPIHWHLCKLIKLTWEPGFDSQQGHWIFIMALAAIWIDPHSDSNHFSINMNRVPSNLKMEATCMFWLQCVLQKKFEITCWKYSCLLRYDNVLSGKSYLGG